MAPEESRPVSTHMDLRRHARRRGAQATRYDPYDAIGEQRVRIALVLQTIRYWVAGGAEYRPLRLSTSGVAGAGKSFVIHGLTDLMRKLLGFPGEAVVYAPTGVAAFQVGGSTGKCPHRQHHHPTTNREAGCRPDRAVEGRIAAKSAWKFKARRSAYRTRTRDGRELYDRAEGVQCRPRTHLARIPFCRIMRR